MIEVIREAIGAKTQQEEAHEQLERVKQGKDESLVEFANRILVLLKMSREQTGIDKFSSENTNPDFGTSSC